MRSMTGYGKCQLQRGTWEVTIELRAVNHRYLDVAMRLPRNLLFLEDGVRGGHGGMDYLVYNEFVQAVYENKPMPIDVYDMAAWMCISTLSEESIQKGSAPVAIPDFTNGRWLLHNAD